MSGSTGETQGREVADPAGGVVQPQAPKEGAGKPASDPNASLPVSPDSCAVLAHLAERYKHLSGDQLAASLKSLRGGHEALGELKDYEANAKNFETLMGTPAWLDELEEVIKGAPSLQEVPLQPDRDLKIEQTPGSPHSLFSALLLIIKSEPGSAWDMRAPALTPLVLQLLAAELRPALEAGTSISVGTCLTEHVKYEAEYEGVMRQVSTWRTKGALAVYSFSQLDDLRSPHQKSVSARTPSGKWWEIDGGWNFTIGSMGLEIHHAESVPGARGAGGSEERMLFWTGDLRDPGGEARRRMLRWHAMDALIRARRGFQWRTPLFVSTLCRPPVVTKLSHEEQLAQYKAQEEKKLKLKQGMKPSDAQVAISIQQRAAISASCSGTDIVAAPPEPLKKTLPFLPPKTREQNRALSETISVAHTFALEIKGGPQRKFSDLTLEEKEKAKKDARDGMGLSAEEAAELLKQKNKPFNPASARHKSNVPRPRKLSQKRMEELTGLKPIDEEMEVDVEDGTPESGTAMLGAPEPKAHGTGEAVDATMEVGVPQGAQEVQAELARTEEDVFMLGGNADGSPGLSPQLGFASLGEGDVEMLNSRGGYDSGYDSSPGTSARSSAGGARVVDKGTSAGAEKCENVEREQDVGEDVEMAVSRADDRRNGAEKLEAREARADREMTEDQAVVEGSEVDREKLDGLALLRFLKKDIESVMLVQTIQASAVDEAAEDVNYAEQYSGGPEMLFESGLVEVLEQVAQLNSSEIPFGDDFDLVARAQALVKRWSALLPASLDSTAHVEGSASTRNAFTGPSTSSRAPPPRAGQASRVIGAALAQAARKTVSNASNSSVAPASIGAKPQAVSNGGPRKQPAARASRSSATSTASGASSSSNGALSVAASAQKPAASAKGKARAVEPSTSTGATGSRSGGGAAPSAQSPAPSASTSTGSAPTASAGKTPQWYSQQEDDIILAERAKNPPTSFAAIHRALGRTNHSAATWKRYQLLLKGTQRNGWTPEEDAKLVQLMTEGYSFKAISTQVPRHSRKACYNRYYALVPDAKRKTAKEGEDENEADDDA